MVPVQVPCRHEHVRAARQVDRHAGGALGERVVLERAPDEHGRLGVEAEPLDQALGVWLGSKLT